MQKAIASDVIEVLWVYLPARVVRGSDAADDVMGEKAYGSTHCKEQVADDPYFSAVGARRYNCWLEFMQLRGCTLCMSAPLSPGRFKGQSWP